MRQAQRPRSSISARSGAPALVGVVAALDAAAAACELKAEDALSDEDDEVEGRKPEPGGVCKRQGIG